MRGEVVQEWTRSAEGDVNDEALIAPDEDRFKEGFRRTAMPKAGLLFERLALLCAALKAAEDRDEAHA
ncbi:MULTISPECIES: hypothetical protein [unclassified Neorhizobium]|uniref:hypothetical protein n=1 Tax=unclassified Neorhizobium TaxID=2629175 RepID=UPI0014055AD5|nr:MULTISPECIES: hypothetical protein [unclassified Neorhizobium]